MAQRYINFRLLGFDLKIPRWTTFFFGIIAVVFVGGSVYRHFFPIDLVSLEEAQHMMSIEIQEYGKHLVDVPKQAFDADDLVVRIYPDTCLLIQRRVNGAVWTKLIPDLSREDFKHRPGDEVPRKSEGLHLLVPLEAAAVSRDCLNPHPGPFQTTYGRRDGCWIEVWRRWPDQCEHVQMFNACNGMWDSERNGAPRVRWTNCRH